MCNTNKDIKHKDNVDIDFSSVGAFPTLLIQSVEAIHSHVARSHTHRKPVDGCRKLLQRDAKGNKILEVKLNKTSVPPPAVLPDGGVETATADGCDVRTYVFFIR